MLISGIIFKTYVSFLTQRRQGAQRYAENEIPTENSYYRFPSNFLIASFHSSGTFTDDLIS